jgi:hypothetical protein
VETRPAEERSASSQIRVAKQLRFPTTPSL